MGNTVFKESPRASWGQERRLEFIDFRLAWEGKINRAELMCFFGMSVQQASLDLAKYMAVAPANIQYDRRDKVYRATSAFRPIGSGDSKWYLDQLAGLENRSLPPSFAFVGWRPSCDIVRFPERVIHPPVLARVLAAIRDQFDLQITYQSMRRPRPSRRWIAPHSIAFDGQRWHARAWCHENLDYRDFVLSRVQSVKGQRESACDPSKDARWHTFVDVVLAPHPALTAEQKVAAEADFGMKAGLLRLSMREALVFYFVRQLHLTAGQVGQRWAQPLIWKNQQDLDYLIQEAVKK